MDLDQALPEIILQGMFVVRMVDAAFHGEGSSALSALPSSGYEFLFTVSITTASNFLNTGGLAYA